MSATGAPSAPLPALHPSAPRPARMFLTADWVLPIVTAPIAQGGVLIDGHQIVWVGPAADAPADLVDGSGDLIRVPLGQAVLLPGLVNVHSHLELTGLRGFLDGLSFGPWLETLTAVRRDLLTADDLLDASRVGVLEALRHGITTLADTGDSAQPLTAMRELGVRGIGFVEVFGPDPRQRDAAMTALEARVEALRIADTDRVRTGISPHAPYTVSAPLYTAAAALAKALDLPVAVHIAESLAEQEFVRDGTGPFAARLRARGIAVGPQAPSPVALLERTGLLATQPLCIHAIHTDAEDWQRLANHGARVAHCPIANAKLGHGMAPLAELLAHGIPTGLGTDSVASNNRMHLLDEARQAVLFASLRAGTPDALSAQEALRLATWGGAQALGLAARIGTLEAGKAADLAAFPIPDDLLPVFDPAVTLVHGLAGRAMASLVLVDGDPLVSGDTIGGADPAWAARLRATGARLNQWRHGGRPMYTSPIGRST